MPGNKQPPPPADVGREHPSPLSHLLDYLPGLCSVISRLSSAHGGTWLTLSLPCVTPSHPIPAPTLCVVHPGLLLGEGTLRQYNGKQGRDIREKKEENKEMNRARKYTAREG